MTASSPRALLVLGAVAALAVGLPAYAAHCETDFYSLCPDQPPCTLYELTDGTAAGTYYLHHRNGYAPDAYWVYEETNGAWTPKPAGAYSSHLHHDLLAHDLQRGGCSAFFPAGCDWLRDCPLLPPDQLLF